MLTIALQERMQKMHTEISKRIENQNHRKSLVRNEAAWYFLLNWSKKLNHTSASIFEVWDVEEMSRIIGDIFPEFCFD